MNAVQDTTSASEFPPGAIVTREPSSADDLEQVEWAEKAMKDAPTAYNAGLRQIVTLASVMLAGSCGFFNQVPAFALLKVIAICTFILTLALASFGLFPMMLRVDPDDPIQVRSARKWAATKKGWILVVAGWMLMGAMTCLAVGVMIGEQKP